MGYLDKVHLVNYSRKEDWMNSISHMAGGAACFVFLAFTIYRAITLHSLKVALVGFIYCVCMLFMFSCSAVYHGLRPNKGKKVMRMVDHSMIFLAIAGTMTPYAVFVLLPIKAWVGWTMLGVAWGAVALGISLTMTLFEKTKWLQMVLYLAVGWSTLLTMKYLYEFFPRTGLILLIAGGVVYTLGAILYGIGKKKKYFHFVFHIFIVAASVLHFLSIYMYVFPFKK
ncbi:MAG: hypothetical protein E7515_04655 [Ruminococcaceae bacterium]|nr:hypothetical protein [Oscillospiraceae bacterium]